VQENYIEGDDFGGVWRGKADELARGQSMVRGDAPGPSRACLVVREEPMTTAHGGSFLELEEQIHMASKLSWRRYLVKVLDIILPVIGSSVTI
jgi:hypothetical protein